MANKDMNRPSLVYIATNLTNGKIYIGVTTEGRLGKRAYEHGRDAAGGSKNAFHRAIRKHGIRNFIFEAVEHHPTMTAALVAEMRLVAERSPEYNSTRGGDVGYGWSLSPASRENQKAACRGNKFRLGKTHTPETREKLRKAAIANPAAIREFGHLGPKAMSKVVVCLNDGSIYESASAAARANGLDKGSVIHLCQRHKKRVAAGKNNLVFRYLGDHHGGMKEVNKILSKRRILNKEVVCLNDGAIACSVLEAAKIYGIARSTLRRHCDDGRPLKGDLKFMFVEDVE